MIAISLSIPWLLTLQFLHKFILTCPGRRSALIPGPCVPLLFKVNIYLAIWLRSRITRSITR